ncbi:hypothetical protein NDU88_000480 [Pleurodeles waltl]|uniref:Uncharacterized protein n=1 Tax=Pleurodeles waltl TaxID=8319 RepID=A0AAV7Q1D0_PLEWA|nr:hypothetical protein NDU88_000480 [Pleurodeles waltl]
MGPWRRGEPWDSGGGRGLRVQPVLEVSRCWPELWGGEGVREVPVLEVSRYCPVLWGGVREELVLEVRRYWPVLWVRRGTRGTGALSEQVLAGTVGWGTGRTGALSEQVLAGTVGGEGYERNRGFK